MFNYIFFRSGRKGRKIPFLFLVYQDIPKKADKIEVAYGEGEEGFAQLRQNAGIAMEYHEKIGIDNKEGDFLKDWEVVFGADKYSCCRLSSK